jgi:hypothetical protein
MNEIIRKIPIKQSWLDDPISMEIEFEAWNVVHDMLFEKKGLVVSEEIRNFYSLGYYGAQVKNGGHSQLVHNMDAGEIRSTFLTNSFQNGALMIGAPEFSEVALKFESWLAANPLEAIEQTGFDDGRADYLDELDAKFGDFDGRHNAQLTKLMDSSTNEFESLYLENCINQKESWSGNLDALSWIWLWRSGVMMPVPNSEYANYLITLGSSSS